MLAGNGVRFLLSYYKVVRKGGVEAPLVASVSEPMPIRRVEHGGERLVLKAPLASASVVKIFV